jgi:hypothetical protein
MKRMILIATRLLFIAVIIYALTGCRRRSLEGNLTPETALIPVHIDWSMSGVPIERMHRASVLLFSEEGGAPLEFRMETSLTDDIIQVPVGVYSVIVFNETTDPTDWSAITFTDKNNYEKFAAVAQAVEGSRGFYTRADDLPLIENPDALAAWSLDRFEVTEDLLERSRSRSRAELAEESGGLTDIVPTPRFETMTIKARVENLSSSMQATGVLDMASGIYMASGEKLSTQGAFAFILGNRIYDPNGDDGITTSTFNIFGRYAPSSIQCDLYIDFLLTDGTLFPRQSFNVTDMIMSVHKGGPPPAEEIIVGISNNSPDHLIELPADMDVKAGVTIDDWDEVVIPLQ